MAVPRLLLGRTGRKNLQQPFGFRRFVAFGVVLWALALNAGPVWAEPQIVTLQRLDFGTLAITTNAAPNTLVVTPLGGATYGTGYVYIAAVKSGRYRLTGYPAYTDISVTLTATPLQLASGVPGEALTVSLATTQPQLLHTDQNGEVTFDLGATLTTSGSGQPYQDGAYAGLPMLTLNFDVAGQPQVSYQNIDADVALRSSLLLTEVQPLNFGKLAVFSSASDQSTLVLGSNGLITLSNPGTARIVRFGGETPATIRVTTGASFAPVQIQLPVAPVYLTHQSLAPEVARLVVTDFAAQPVSGSAILDALGAMDFRIGATLRTEQTSKRYQDGVYTGTYEVTVEY